MCRALDMERQILESTDIDIKPHLMQLAEDLNMDVPLVGMLTNEDAIDAIESRMDTSPGQNQI